MYEEDKKQQLANEAIAAQLQAQAQAINKISSSDVTMQQYDQSTAPTVGNNLFYDYWYEYILKVNAIKL